MSEKIYVISCSHDMVSMGMDRMRSSTEQFGELEIAVDWSATRIVPVVAAEKVPFHEGETKLVPIRPIEVPSFALVFKSFYGTNGMGDLGCIGCTEMKAFAEKRVANVSMFSSRIKASVLPGDLLGQVLIVQSKKE